MSGPLFKDTTVSFNSVPLEELQGLDFTAEGGKVMVSAAGDTGILYAIEDPDVTVVATFIGLSPNVAIGDVGALTIAWNNGSSGGTLSNAGVQRISEAGRRPEAIIATVAWVPAKVYS